MNDSLTTKKVTDLPESTEPADEDLFLAGGGGSASLIRYKWSSIWNKILASIRSKIIVNNLVTTVAGYALDAQQGRILKAQLDEQNTKIYYKDYEFDLSYEAGTIGTRGMQFTIDVSGEEGVPFCATPWKINSSSNYLPVGIIAADSKKVYLNFYRASTIAVSNYTDGIRVGFIKL